MSIFTIIKTKLVITQQIVLTDRKQVKIPSFTMMMATQLWLDMEPRAEGHKHQQQVFLPLLWLPMLPLPLVALGVQEGQEGQVELVATEEVELVVMVAVVQEVMGTEEPTLK